MVIIDKNIDVFHEMLYNITMEVYTIIILKGVRRNMKCKRLFSMVMVILFMFNVFIKHAENNEPTEDY